MRDALGPENAVTCPVCGDPFTPKRRDQEVCGSTCRQRRHRERDRAYVVTEEDRAAMRRVLERDGHGHPRGERLDAEDVRQHLLVVNARRVGG